MNRAMWALGALLAGAVFVLFAINTVLSLPITLVLLLNWLTEDGRFTAVLVSAVFLLIRFGVTWGAYTLMMICWRRVRPVTVSGSGPVRVEPTIGPVVPTGQRKA
jgi:hypothetical protein